MGAIQASAILNSALRKKGRAANTSAAAVEAYAERIFAREGFRRSLSDTEQELR